MTVQELFNKIRSIPCKDEVRVYFCPRREMEETQGGDWRWKDCVAVDDTDLERISTGDGWYDEDERNLILLPEEV